MPEKPVVVSFSVSGLQYYQNFSIDFEKSVSILVGENGQGKTTILNILYAILSKRWFYLTNCAFDSTQLKFKNDEVIEFSHSELDAFLIQSNFNAEYEMGIDLVMIQNKFERIEGIISKSVGEIQVLYLPVFRNIREELGFLKRTFETLKYQLDDLDSAESEYNSVENELLIPTELGSLIETNDIPSRRLNKFIEVCNSYLVNTQFFISDDRKLTLLTKRDKEEVPVKHLSSGESQIVYIFSKIYLNNFEKQYILFDEPENALSILWQRRILSDIAESGYCSFLLAISHSPFVFDNNLVEYASGINVHLSE